MTRSAARSITGEVSQARYHWRGITNWMPAEILQWSNSVMYAHINALQKRHSMREHTLAQWYAFTCKRQVRRLLHAYSSTGRSLKETVKIEADVRLL